MIFPIGKDVPNIHPTAFIHPSAEISGKVRIGAGSSIWGGCILRGDVDWIEIGEECNIQDGSIFHTSHGVPVKLAKGVTVGHKATIHGGMIDSYSLIGMSATLLDNSVVESNCMVGAGALVGESSRIPKGHLAVGIPAKVKRPLSETEIEMIIKRASNYVSYAKTYKDALKQSGF